jgi:NAD(P)-dependent dehydrogenase (short-subunit alcohol dehydrogenase family)
VAAQQTLAKTVGDAFGQLDILCVNAALLPAFANPASIVLTTSVNAHIGMPASPVYSASKAALLSLARTLSGELIPRGIRVNAVSPGSVATPLYDKLGPPKEGVKEMSESLKTQIPVRRFGTPAEIARTIVCFASEESAYTVGSELIVDGGMSNL